MNQEQEEMALCGHVRVGPGPHEKSIRAVWQAFPRYLNKDGDIIILHYTNDNGHYSRDVYRYVSGSCPKWAFVRASTNQDIADALVYERKLPANASVKDAQNERLAFSWLSTKQVCQVWAAAFAAYPNDGRTH